VIRRLLIGLLMLVAAIILGGGLWLATLMLRGGNDTTQLLEVFRWEWLGLIVGSAIIGVVAAILQLTRPPTEGWDWTYTASLGTGACLYALVLRPFLPVQWKEAFPVPLSEIVPLAVTVAVTYAVLLPLLRRRPAEPSKAAVVQGK
jgi:hypothetical protein